MSIRKKLTSSFLLVALLVGVLRFFGYSNLKDTANQVDVITEQETPALAKLSEIKSFILEAVEEAFAYPLLDEPQEKVEFFDNLEQFDTSVGEFREIAHIGQRGQEEETELLHQIVSAKEATAISARNMFESYERDGAVNLSHVADFEADIDRLIPLIDQFLEIENREVAEAQQDIQATIANQERLTVIVVSVAVLLAIGLGIFVSRSISIPVNRLKDAAEELGKGNLGVRANVEGGDEIGSLATSFNQMAAALQQGHELESANANLEEKVEERVRELRDANEQLLAETRERQQLEEQLRQSQKMEAIGRLAGGVAHDFNNLLTPIMGYAQMEMAKLPSGDRSGSSLEQIHKAAERAANLTRQLLAFSRHQIVKHEVLNLNDLIIDLDRLLRRLLGHDIELVTLPSSTLDLVKADPGQIELVIINLAVNARDAMPNRGKLTIETANITLGETGDESGALQHSDASSGPHVMLSVTDTGGGMTKEVQSRIFEPFFTTKEEGKGTGLGLSTCFGIASQSGGHIEVQSDLGQGTTLKLYLPSTESAIRAGVGSGESETPGVSLGGTETVLLAEDEPLVRKLVVQVLRDRGYQVMAAATGQEALKIFQSQEPDSVHMLLPDVVMPQMGGIELAQRITDIQPNTKVLFASGYTEEPLFLAGDPSQEIRFIQKPFLPDALALKVREVLDWQPAGAEV